MLDINDKSVIPQPKELAIQELGDEQYKLSFEQYKLLVESINKINETRESSNNFWIGANGVGISILAYLRDTQNIQYHHKSFLLGALVVIGIIFTLSWLSYLRTIKQSLELRSKCLVELEKIFPVPVFSRIFASPPESSNQTVLAVLTIREMLVPYLFFAGYIFFAILLFFFPEEVISSSGTLPAS